MSFTEPPTNGITIDCHNRSMETGVSGRGSNAAPTTCAEDGAGNQFAYPVPYRANSPDLSAGAPRTAEREPANLLDASPVMMWSVGPDKRYYYFNRAWLKYRGRTADQEIRTDPLDGVHPDDAKERLLVHDRSFEGRCRFEIDYRLRRYDGQFRWIAEYGAPRISPVGDLIGFTGCCVDVHDRKLSEEALRNSCEDLRKRNGELEQFAFGASHDLQEPLRTIATNTELIARHYAGDGRDADPSFGFISGAVDRMQSLIRDLLNYSCLVQRAEPILVDVDCNIAVRQALFACQAAIQQCGAVITHPNLPTVRADESQLVQVLQNLVSNAVKYSRPEEPPRVHISASSRADGWLFEVSDNGVGFDPAYSDRIFELFKRLHSRAERSGSGIGLSICKRIIEQHGGRIWATSERLRGSRFFFTLPR
jgi:PAS domain S-box-containing protein